MNPKSDTNATQLVESRRGTQLAGRRRPDLGRFRHLSRFKIGPRLVFCFLVILALMLAGDGLLLWQFHRVHVQSSRLTAAGEELIAISRFQADFFRLNARLDELAKSRDIEGLKKEAETLREALLGDIDQARNSISHSPAELHPGPTILPTLEAIESTLPSQLEKVIALAEASDWEAVRLRLANEKKPLEAEVSILVRTVEQQVSAELAAELMESARVQQRILVIVPSTAVFTLLVATFLGLVVTRSITLPLARLMAGSKALAKGDFSHRIPAEGDDELATLGEVFNDMIVRLQELYGDVRRSEARWRSVFENSAVGVALTDLNGRFIATNDAYQKMLGYSEEELKGLSLLDVTEEEAHQPTRTLIGELLEGKRQQFQIEKHNRRKNGTLVWVRKNVSLVSGTDEVPQFLMALSEDVTERKRAEEALQRSERDLAAIINTIPTAAWSTRPDGYCDFINQVWLDYAGMTAEKAQGWGWSEAIHPDDRKKLIEDWQSCLASGTPIDMEARIRRFDAACRWFLIRANPLRDESGNIVKWYGTCIDIDDRKKAEEALQSSQRNLSLMINAIPTLISVLRTDGSVLYVNQAVLDYTGLTLEDVQKDDYRSRVFHPEDVERLREERREALTRAVPFENEQRVLNKEGKYRWFLIRFNPLLDEQGRIDRWYVAATDIDDRKRAEAQVEQAYLRLAEAQRLSKTGSFITDLVADDHNWSEEAFRIFEFEPAAKVTVQMIRGMVHPEDLPLFDSVIARGMTGNDVDFLFRIVTTQGAMKHIRGMARVIEQVAGRPLFIGALQDVTESKVAEEALNRARSELAYVARVTTLNTLTASIAHEVNQPLSGIITNASTCLRMLDGDPPNIGGARETARRTIRDGNRAADVIKRLRALFSKKEFTPEALDLNEATREVIALSLSDLQRNRVILRSEFADDLPPVTGDRIQLQQVILNLVRNASDAMGSVDDRPRDLLIRTEREGKDRVRLSVKDVGLGFTPETADKLFHAFYTTKKDGMGIGLSVSRSIIEAHDGRLWAAANDGPGATFSFAIPCRPEGLADIENRDYGADSATNAA